MRKKPRAKKLKPRWKKSRLEELVRRAIGDVDDPDEQETAFYEALAEQLRFPFRLKDGIARGLAVDADDDIVVLCDGVPGGIPILELEIPKPAPPGAEWIEAYRLWTSE